MRPAFAVRHEDCSARSRVRCRRGNRMTPATERLLADLSSRRGSCCERRARRGAAAVAPALGHLAGRGATAARARPARRRAAAVGDAVPGPADGSRARRCERRRRAHDEARRGRAGARAVAGRAPRARARDPSGDPHAERVGRRAPVAGGAVRRPRRATIGPRTTPPTRDRGDRLLLRLRSARQRDEARRGLARVDRRGGRWRTAHDRGPRRRRRRRRPERRLRSTGSRGPRRGGRWSRRLSERSGEGTVVRAEIPCA